MAGEDILVDPDRLVCVTHVLPDGSSAAVVAIVCAYVVLQQAGKAVIAIEVVYDPEAQPPSEIAREAYRCPFDRLQRRLLPPKDVKTISIIEAAVQHQEAL